MSDENCVLKISSDLLSGLRAVEEPKDVESYMIHSDGGMIYNPLSSEANIYGNLNKYQGSPKKTVEMQLDSIKAIFTVPVELTAYDIVPIEYRLLFDKTVTEPTYVQADAFTQESKRKGRHLYDLNVPGIVDVDFEFVGYVSANTISGARPLFDKNYEDDPAKVYPNYIASDIIHSSEVDCTDRIWFNFKYTNTGNTILDNDGNGSFCFEPILQKKNEHGDYENFTIPNNMFYRIDDYIYPGESGQLWISFVAFPGFIATSDRLDEGEYRILLHCAVRNEQTDPKDYMRILWSGQHASTSAFDFTVKLNAGVVVPAPTKKLEVNRLPRNRWLHSYEEFMSCYDTWSDPNKQSESGTLYLQIAPWTEQIVLKLIYGESDNIVTAAIAVMNETESISIRFNSENSNFIVKDDGTRYPVIAAQNMIDMRVNIALGPDSGKEIINQTLDLLDCGINLVVTTAGFNYNTFQGKVLDEQNAEADNANWSFIIAANWFSMDVYRALGIAAEGFISYPFNNAQTLTIANWISGNDFPAEDIAGFGDQVYATANAIRAGYNYGRWGENFWLNSKGEIPFVIEDTRGWLMPYQNIRFTDGPLIEKRFKEWLKQSYISVEQLNTAWGSNFDRFESISPESDGVISKFGHKYDYTNRNAVFYDYSRAMADYDIFRTLERIYSYESMMREIKKVICNATLIMRTETYTFMASGINPGTDNPRYRATYYSQRRGAMIPEIIQTSGIVFAHSDYVSNYYKASEVYELTKIASEQGIIEMHLPLFNRLRDTAINPKYGDSVKDTYNTASDQKGAYINTIASLFTWWKATYEAGGIPGIIWSDFLCDGVVGATQRKEMVFFIQKLNHALSTAQGEKWKSNFERTKSPTSSKSNAKWSYNSEFVVSEIERTKRERL